MDFSKVPLTAKRTHHFSSMKTTVSRTSGVTSLKEDVKRRKPSPRVEIGRYLGRNRRFRYYRSANASLRLNGTGKRREPVVLSKTEPQDRLSPPSFTDCGRPYPRGLPDVEVPDFESPDTIEVPLPSLFIDDDDTLHLSDSPSEDDDFSPGPARLQYIIKINAPAPAREFPVIPEPRPDNRCQEEDTASSGSDQGYASSSSDFSDSSDGDSSDNSPGRDSQSVATIHTGYSSNDDLSDEFNDAPTPPAGIGALPEMVMPKEPPVKTTTRTSHASMADRMGFSTVVGPPRQHCSITSFGDSITLPRLRKTGIASLSMPTRSRDSLPMANVSRMSPQRARLAIPNGMRPTKEFSMDPKKWVMPEI